MKLPEINETVTTEWALDLCKHFKLDYLIERIEKNKDKYTSWKFDGISCSPEWLAARLTGVDQKSLTNECALPHDLSYAYGNPEDKKERKMADEAFRNNLRTKARMPLIWAYIFYCAVRMFGLKIFSLSFSWTFALKK